MSKKIVLAADGLTATVADATVGDVFTTIVSSNTALTGPYKYMQSAVLVAGGMAAQNYRLGRGLNFLKAQ